MTTLSLQGRGAVGGIAEGEALVCPDSIQGWSGIDDHTGVIIEKGHVAEGTPIDGRILVLPASKGSNCWSGHFHAAMINGKKPAGWVVRKIDSRVGVAAVVLGIPLVTDFEGDDPCQIIRTGDWVRVDGDRGVVEVISKSDSPTA